jgi:hypothetical protein
MLPMMCLMAIMVMEGFVWRILTSWWLPYLAPEDDPNRYEDSPIAIAMAAVVLSLERLTNRIKKEPPSESNTVTAQPRSMATPSKTTQQAEPTVSTHVKQDSQQAAHSADLTPYELYHDNGSLKQKGTLKDGEKHGPYEAYYQDGLLRGKGTHKNGKPYGSGESYYSDGCSLEQKARFKDGKLHGPYERYYATGEVMEKYTLKEGRNHGPYERYASTVDAPTLRGMYNMGEKCGEWIENGKTVTYDPCPDCDDE